MNGIMDQRLEKYIYSLLPARDAVLTEMEQLAEERHIPIIGPAVGRLLYLLAQVSGAQRIFEMGSAIGYSTIWLARAAGARAEIYYTDSDAENGRRANDYFRRAGVLKRVRILVGDALESIEKVRGKFDLIFIDVDKHQYPAALRLALPRVRRGGLLIADNTLWSGRVARAAKGATGMDKQTRGIQEFNRKIYSSPNLFPVIIPLRDGVAVCRKL